MLATLAEWLNLRSADGRWRVRPSFLALVVLLVVINAERLQPPPGTVYADFASFFASGHAVSIGENPYAVGGDTPNLNPPISLLAFQFLAQAEPLTVYQIWHAASLVLYVLLVALLLHHYPKNVTPLRLIWLAAFGGFWVTMALGQIYLPLALASGSAWFLLRQGRRVAPGILIGLVVAIKPNFVLWTVLLLVAGHAVVASAALVTAAAVSVLPLLRYGPVVYTQWFRATQTYGGAAGLHDASLYALGVRGGLPQVGVALAAALIVGLAVWAWRGRLPVLQISAVALIASLLCSPLAWLGYSLFLLPIFASRRWNRSLALAAVVLALPVAPLEALIDPLTRVSPWLEATLGQLYSVAFLLIALGVFQTTKIAIIRPSPVEPPALLSR